MQEAWGQATHLKSWSREVAVSRRLLTASRWASFSMLSMRVATSAGSAPLASMSAIHLLP